MEKVFVSGGSGFISLHLISKLIQEGYKVRTSLRSLDRKQEVIDAVEKEVSTAGMLEFCELDLLKDEGWDEAVAGCDYVQHIASPIPTSHSNDFDVVVKPAVNGIRRCLEAALKNNIKRFVMTSSVAAVGGSNHKNEYDDSDWTDLSMKVAPYQTSKTKAERFLWDFIEKNKDKIINNIPIKRIGVPDDISSLTKFLASDKASYITGQTFHVNGGMFM